MMMTTTLRTTGVLLVLSVAHAVAGGGAQGVVGAAKDRDHAAVRALLQQGVDVNGPAADGSTALAWAAHWNDLETADVLIRAGADVNAANDYGVRPVALACTNGSAAMVERLVAAGADPNAARLTGGTALMTCARTGNPDAIRTLLAAGADVNAREPRRGQTALMWAADQNHADATQVLIEAGAELAARSQEGYTPLIFAARAGGREVVQILLARGANVNDVVAPTAAPTSSRGGYGARYDTSSPGASALLVATVRGHWDVARLLLQQGADPNAQGAGYTALHWAVGEWESDLTGPFGAVGYDWVAGLQPGKHEFVKALLAHGADPNARITALPPRLAFTISAPQVRTGTPFMLAARAGDVAIMQALLAAGADPLLTMDDHTTALMTAAGLGRTVGESRVTPHAALEATRLALEVGHDVNAANDAGETALHGAAYAGAEEVVQFLVDRGARVNARNKTHGYTPLTIAEGFVGANTGGNTFRHLGAAAVLRALGGEEGVEFEGPITRLLVSDCPSSTVLVMPPAMGVPRPGRGHVVQTRDTTHFENGRCADLQEGVTVAVTGIRQIDYSIAVSKIRISTEP